MNRLKANGPLQKHILFLLLGILSACLLFAVQYRLDNKYRFHGPYGQEGVLDLREDSSRLHMLAYGWEIYPQELLTPEELGHTPPSEYICLGEFGGFETGDANASPHGYASYHLTILLPSQSREYTLEIPEIYSTSRIYVNGQLLWQSGNPDPDSYQPGVRTGSVSFTASGSADIVVQASDYSHYYSGMVYPPAFGPSASVDTFLNARYLLRCIMCLSAFGIGVLYFVIGWGVRKRRVLSLLFSLFAFSFSGYACYPVLHSFGTGMWSYVFEDLCFYLMLFSIAALQTHLCGIRGIVRAVTLSVCGAVCVMSLIVPSWILKDDLAAMLLYSDVIDLYKFLLFGWLISTSFLAFRKMRQHLLIFLTGLCIFAAALLYNVLAPMFEPVLLGWQTEIAAFLFVLLLAFTLWRDIIRVYTERCLLDENIRMMKKQLVLQEQNYQLLTEHFEDIRTMRHDMRQHLRILGELQKNGDYEGLADYLSSISKMNDDLNSVPICQNLVVNAILHYFSEEARRLKVTLTLKVSLPENLLIENWELGVLFGNLVENALEASQKLPVPDRKIFVNAGLSGRNLVITVKNTYNGSFLCKENQFYSSKHDGPGIGLSSVQSITDKYGGKLYIDPGDETFQASVVIWNI